jgi:hypothetical protein
MITLFVTSPINKNKVAVGAVDTRYKEAIFYISGKRYFAEADACGIDQNVYNRKAVQYCNHIRFDLWDGRIFKINRLDFEANCWIYQKTKSEKAPRGKFTPKLMIGVTKLQELHKKNAEEEAEQMVKDAVFG